MYNQELSYLNTTYEVDLDPRPTNKPSRPEDVKRADDVDV